MNSQSSVCREAMGREPGEGMQPQNIVCGALDKRAHVPTEHSVWSTVWGHALTEHCVEHCVRCALTEHSVGHAHQSTVCGVLCRVCTHRALCVEQRAWLHACLLAAAELLRQTDLSYAQTPELYLQSSQM